MNSTALHESLAWEIARALPEGGAVLCVGADASSYFERLDLVLAPGFGEEENDSRPQMWIKPPGHKLDPATMGANFSLEDRVVRLARERNEDSVREQLSRLDKVTLRTMYKECSRLGELTPSNGTASWGMHLDVLSSLIMNASRA